MAGRLVSRAALAALFAAVCLFAGDLQVALLAQGSAPPAPVNLTASVIGTTVSLSWQNGPNTRGTVTYLLEAGSRAGRADLVSANTMYPAALATNVANGTYYVRVKTRSSTGALSGPSNEVVVVVGCAGAPAVPAAPTVSVSGGTINVGWTAVPGATGYILEAGNTPGASNVGAFPMAGTGISAVAPAGLYYIRIRAANACGMSAPSPERLAAVAVTPPAEICGNGIDDDSDGQIDEGCPPPPPPPTEICGNGIDDDGDGLIDEGCPPPPPAPTEICGNGIDDDGDGQIDEGCPTTPQIWGAVDATTMGTCSMAIHDTFVVDGGDGWRYRTWHPQTVTVNGVTCTFGHEHGDNPARMTNAEIASSPVRFGYIGRRMAHEEPHEGFKVFIALPGDVNDEGRVNRVFSRSVFHMGTGGPRRFNMQHHSAEIRLIHPEFGLKAFTQLMMDTGGVGAVCDPRKPAPIKDVVSLNNPCKLNSFYEIWSTTASVMFQGREIYRAFATPAVFDPITVFNPANPTELVYAWDTRLNTSLNFPTNDRSYFRGCDRESYATPGYWYNAGTNRTTYYTDVHGGELPSTDPNALAQIISTNYSVGVPATNDGLLQFKRRVNYCGSRSALGLKN